jgi:hypothetical protein
MTREEANIFEKICVKSFLEIGFNLVNKINGGSGNSKRKPLTEEGRLKMSENIRKYWDSINDEERKEFGKMMSENIKRS